MSFSPTALLESLESPEIRDWHLELKHGLEAYAFLIDAIRRRTLSSNQMRNALHALFLIRGHGSSEEVLDVLVDASLDHDCLVRSEAVQLALGLEWFSASYEKKPVVLSEEHKRRLKLSFEEGLTPSVDEQWRRRFPA